MRSVLILLAVLTALPATARAGLAVPAEVVPGEQVVVEGSPGLAGGVVTLRPDDERLVVGVVGTPFVWPTSYAGRRFLPGQRVPLDACSVPVVTGTPAAGIMASSTFCLGGETVVGGRVRALLRGRVEPRRAGVLRSARWTAWGSATARARGFSGRRRATAVAAGLVDCGGTAAYSTLTVRQDGRVLQALRLPC
jgi:hypothetical protein